jgi:uncharacterized protein (UPF0335 family)
MTTKNQIQAYAPQLAEIYRKIDSLNFDAKDLLASAKDAGVNVSALRKVAKELLMEADKRAKKYEDEAQTDLFRDALGLTSERMLEAAE